MKIITNQEICNYLHKTKNLDEEQNWWKLWKNSIDSVKMNNWILPFGINWTESGLENLEVLSTNQIVSGLETLKKVCLLITLEKLKNANENEDLYKWD